MIKTLNKFSLFLRINKIEGEKKKSGKYNFVSIPELILFLVGTENMVSIKTPHSPMNQHFSRRIPFLAKSFSL